MFYLKNLERLCLSAKLLLSGPVKNYSVISGRDRNASMSVVVGREVLRINPRVQSCLLPALGGLPCP